jgi:alpha-pyrone synthase
LVCIELCTLHFQKAKTQDHLLSNALFGDGAAALLISGKKYNTINLSMNRFFCDLAPEGKNDMAWHVGDFGFEMTLTSYIPGLIKGGISQLTHNLLNTLSLSVEDIDYFAIHPGGRRILEAIEQALGLSKEDNRHAYEVLRYFGNMSSPTVLFVLKSIWSELTSADAGKNILSFAFGPGLTLESMLLSVATIDTEPLKLTKVNGKSVSRKEILSDRVTE